MEDFISLLFYEFCWWLQPDLDYDIKFGSCTIVACSRCTKVWNDGQLKLSSLNNIKSKYVCFVSRSVLKRQLGSKWLTSFLLVALQRATFLIKLIIEIHFLSISVPLHNFYVIKSDTPQLSAKVGVARKGKWFSLMRTATLSLIYFYTEKFSSDLFPSRFVY